MYLNMLLQELCESQKPATELLKANAEMNVNVLESDEYAHNVSKMSSLHLQSTTAEYLARRGVRGQQFQNGKVVLEYNHHATVYEIKKEMDRTADVAVAAMMALDYNAAALEHAYRKSGITDQEAELNTGEILGRAYVRAIANFKDVLEKETEK